MKQSTSRITIIVLIVIIVILVIMVWKYHNSPLMRLRRAVKRRQDEIEDKLIKLNDKSQPYLGDMKHSWLVKYMDEYNLIKNYLGDKITNTNN